MDPIINPTLDAQNTPSPTDPVAGDEASGGKTPEEIEAYWRRRVSLKDRSHTAAERALREELESWKAKATATPGANGQPGNGADQTAAEIEALRREIAAKDTLYGRKSKYPNLNGKVSDATIMASDEADLARFNEMFDDTSDGGTFIAPTAPRKTTPPARKSYEQMTKDELLVELDRETRKMAEERSAGF